MYSHGDVEDEKACKQMVPGMWRPNLNLSIDYLFICGVILYFVPMWSSYFLGLLPNWAHSGPASRGVPETWRWLSDPNGPASRPIMNHIPSGRICISSSLVYFRIDSIFFFDQFKEASE
jgi:hypothetical protein